MKKVFFKIKSWFVVTYYCVFLKKIKVLKNTIVTWYLTKKFSRNGKKIAQKYVVGQTYYNEIKNCYGIYRGNNKFFETKQILEPTYGIEFYDSKEVEYTDLQIGLFKDLWVRKNVNVRTDCGPELMNNPFLSTNFNG